MKYEVTAKRIEMALEERAMNAQTLADLSGVNKSSISQYRHGRNIPNAHSARAMSAILGVTPEWLMGFGDDNIEKHIDSTYFQINQLWTELTTDQRKTIVHTAKMFAELNQRRDQD